MWTTSPVTIYAIQVAIRAPTSEGSSAWSLMRRSIASLALATAALWALLCASTASAAAPLGGVPRSVAAPGSHPSKLDRDGDKVFDDLEDLLVGRSPDDQLRVIVTLRAPASVERIGALERATGSFEVRRRFSIIDGFAATVRAGQVRSLAAAHAVDHIEVDSVAHALNDAAQDSFGVTKARADASQLDGDGDGNPASYSKNDFVAAVIDTGVDPGHLDLDEGKVLAFRDFVNGRTAAYDDDLDGHGTHVSASLAGDGDARPDRLYEGVAPGAGLVGVKVLDRHGNGSEGNVIAGIDWAVQNKSAYGIEALNLSLGIAGCSDGSDATSQAVNNATDAGLVVAVAAGNEGPGTCTVGSPGAAAKALTVGAMADLASNGFYQAYFSSRGKTADGRIKPDVSGPGVNITSAQARTTNGYHDLSGTSMATPFAAGVALLMLDANSALTPQQVKDKLMQTSIDWGRGGDNRTAGSSGPDIDYGAGRMDAYAAIRAAGANINTPPIAPAHELREGSLSGTGARVDYPLQVTDTRFPIAATMIIASLSSGSASSPDFDLYLYDPNGNQVASSPFTLRQEDLGYRPTVTGTYTLRVISFSGSGNYFVDISTAPRPQPYAFPIGASPTRAALVPAFQACNGGTANGAHAGPLAGSSCAPPVPRSSLVAVGSRSLGFARLTVLSQGQCAPFDSSRCHPDVTIRANVTDVRSGSPNGADYDTPSSQDLTLVASSGLRITDQYNKLNSGTTYDQAGTVAALSFPVPLSCSPTADPSIGSTCDAQTTVNALVPGAAVAGKRAVWELGQLQLLDQGSNGTPGDSDDKPFEVEGVFVP